MHREPYREYFSAIKKATRMKVLFRPAAVRMRHMKMSEYSFDIVRYIENLQNAGKVKIVILKDDVSENKAEFRRGLNALTISEDTYALLKMGNYLAKYLVAYALGCKLMHEPKNGDAISRKACVFASRLLSVNELTKIEKDFMCAALPKVLITESALNILRNLHIKMHRKDYATELLEFHKKLYLAVKKSPLSFGRTF